VRLGKKMNLNVPQVEMPRLQPKTNRVQGRIVGLNKQWELYKIITPE
jgi:hypothetical protein